MQPGMNTSKAHYYTSRLLDQGPKRKQVRLSSAPSPPPNHPPPGPQWMLQFSAPWPTEIISGVWVVFVGLLLLYWDVSSVLLGAVAIMLITGSHTIQQRNVNPELCCSWTCRNTIESFSNFLVFLILHLIALEQSVSFRELHIFTHFTNVFVYISLTRRHNRFKQFGNLFWDLLFL